MGSGGLTEGSATSLKPIFSKKRHWSQHRRRPDYLRCVIKFVTRLVGQQDTVKGDQMIRTIGAFLFLVAKRFREFVLVATGATVHLPARTANMFCFGLLVTFVTPGL